MKISIDVIENNDHFAVVSDCDISQQQALDALEKYGVDTVSIRLYRMSWLEEGNQFSDYGQYTTNADYEVQEDR